MSPTDEPDLSYPKKQAYISGIVRADERTRTAYPCSSCEFACARPSPSLCVRELRLFRRFSMVWRRSFCPLCTSAYQPGCSTLAVLTMAGSYLGVRVKLGSSGVGSPWMARSWSPCKPDARPGYSQLFDRRVGIGMSCPQPGEFTPGSLRYLHYAGRAHIHTTWSRGNSKPSPPPCKDGTGAVA